MLEQYLVCVSQPLVQVTFIDWARPKIGCRQYKLISVFMFCQHEIFYYFQCHVYLEFI